MILCGLATNGYSQNYKNSLSGKTTEITFYSPDIVRVTKYQTSDALAKSDPKYVVTMTPQNIETSVHEGTTNDTIIGGNLKVIYNKTLGTISFYREDGSLLIKERNSGSITKRTSHTIDPFNVSQTFTLSSSEAIYGFGQVQDGNMSHRGCSYSHMVQNNMSVWIPYFHSVKGYGIYWDLYGPCDFSDSSSNGATFKTEAAHAIDYYVLVGAKGNGDDVVRRIRELTGQATMVPMWTFGYAQSKERYESAKETLGVLQKYRSLRIPIDCVVQDWQYWGGNNQWNAMEFLNPSFSSDYKTMIDGIHKGNGHLLISFWANFGPDTKQYAHFKSTNQLMKMGNEIMTSTYPGGSGVAIYSPYQQSARNYYWDCLFSGLVNKGVDAYWVDSSEPDHYQGGDDWEKTNDFVVLNKNGKDDATLNPNSIDSDHTWRSVRNVFPLMHASGVYDGHRAQLDDLTEAKRVMIMTRSGFIGMQRYGAGTWSGDITASWQTLANQIPAALNYSACGIPSWNSDIGGFFNGSYKGPGQDIYNELYARWIQFGTFCTIMRSHGSGTDRAIYTFGKEGESYYDIIARYINLRYALLPYIYSTARNVHNDGYSFMRAMGLAYPSDTRTYSLKDQFMFGRDLLVAPVIESNASKRSVYLPSGENWTDIWTGEKHNGGTKITRNVNLATMPIYVRQGIILPWGPKVQYSSESNWDNLEIRIYPGKNGTFTLYEDERDNYNYEKGLFSEIPFEWNDSTSTLTIGDRKGEFKGMLAERTFNIVLVDPDKHLGLGIQQSARFSKQIKYDGKTISAKIANNDLTEESHIAVKSISATPSKSTLYLGQASNIIVKANYDNGTSEYVTLDADYESTNSSVAYVRDGIIHAGFEVGHADISISYTDAFGTKHTATIGVDASIPTNVYAWKAYDWYKNRVSDRLSSSNIKYSSADNTITITKTGSQNIALRYSDKTYMEPGAKYLVAVASEISTKKEDSQLWHLNNQWKNVTNPDYVLKLTDGRIMVVWNMDEIKSYTLTGETIFGMTSTNAKGQSVISYVGFVSNYQTLKTQLQNAVGIEETKSDIPSASSIYNINGTKLSQISKGINIVKNDKESKLVYK